MLAPGGSGLRGLFCGLLAAGLVMTAASQARAQGGSIRSHIEDHLLRLDFEPLDELLTYEHDPSFERFYRAHKLFLRALTQQSGHHFKVFLQRCDHVTDYLDAQPRSTFRDALIAELYVEEALIHYLDNANLAAANALRNAKKAARRQLERYPDQAFGYRPAGLLQLLFSAVPEEYQWAAKLIGWTGDLMLGMEQLSYAATESRILPAETQIILYFAERNLMNDKAAAFARIDSLERSSPGHPLFTYLWAHSAIDRHQTDEAISSLAPYRKRHQWLPQQLPQADLLLGRAYLYRQSYREAETQLGSFLTNYAGQAYRPEAHFKWAMTAMLSGDFQTARSRLETVANMEATGLDEDAYALGQAAYYLEHGFREADIRLRKARYLFDGGYFERATAVLATLKELRGLTRDERAELYYRQARILHERGKPVRARSYYTLCLKQHCERCGWLQAYSNLYIAQLFEAEADWGRAQQYYRDALAFDDIYFQNGLQQKAKAGLERIRHKQATADGTD